MGPAREKRLLAGLLCEMWSRQPTPTRTERSASVSAAKITAQNLSSIIQHFDIKPGKGAAPLFLGREPNVRKVNDPD